jgi:hypothetical protein
MGHPSLDPVLEAERDTAYGHSGARPPIPESSRQTPFPVLPLPHFFPHLAVAERGAP